MKFKVFIAACISAACIAIPNNIIGCGPDEDPYDYYTTFFHPKLADTRAYEPFYYSGIKFLYDENEPKETTDVLASEWAAYCGKHIYKVDAKELVFKYSGNEVENIKLIAKKKGKDFLPKAARNNSMAQYLIKNRDYEALDYIIFAKKIEPFVMGNDNRWEPIVREGMKMKELINICNQKYNSCTKNFLKLRYAYQLVRLEFYNNNDKDAFKHYEKYIIPNPAKSILKNLSLSLKAGALFRMKKYEEAAYLYSKAFFASDAKKVSNYLSFKWSTSEQKNKKAYLRLCKTNEERAGMLAMFALSNKNEAIKTLKEIYHLYPSSKVLEVLAVREINKLEESYLTPMLEREKGGLSLYYNRSTPHLSKNGQIAASKLATKMIAFFCAASKNKKIKNPSIFALAAAYTSFIVKDYDQAKAYIVAAENLHPSARIAEQCRLTRLLVKINERKEMDAVLEEYILPDVKWLENMAKKDKKVKDHYYNDSYWKNFYRNLMSEVVAQRYHQQGDMAKEALAYGMAEMRMMYPEYDYYSNSIDFLRNKVTQKDVVRLYTLLTKKNPSNFEKYLFRRNPINQTRVIDFMGTAYLREYDYTNAIAWFKKTRHKESLAIYTNPFIELLNDREEQLPSEVKFKTTKIAFAQEMQRLMAAVKNSKTNQSKNYYKLATGLYNMSYYGHAWKLVQYFRPSTEGYDFPEDASRFEKEYYGCFNAHNYFAKAMNASTDKNFKARCLFMMAKCSQKQLRQPNYYAYKNDDDRRRKDEAAFFDKFHYNKYFPTFVKEYRNTPFYKEAYNSCSYLRDFVNRK